MLSWLHRLPTILGPQVTKLHQLSILEERGEIRGGGDDGTCRRGEIKAKAHIGERSDWSDSDNGKIAADRVKKSNRGKHGRDGENGVRNNGKNDICNKRKNGKKEDDWIFDVDSDSNNECDSGGYDCPCLPDRPPRKFLPSQRQAMRLLSMAVPPEDRAHFKERFHAFATGKETSPCPLTGTTGKVYNTNAAWIAAVYGCDFVRQLQCTADMFPFSKAIQQDMQIECAELREQFAGAWGWCCNRWYWSKDAAEEKPKDCLPSHMSVMGIIMKCLPICGPDGMDRFEFKRSFRVQASFWDGKEEPGEGWFGLVMFDANLLY